MTGLVFTEAEWNAEMPRVVKEMTGYLSQYRTPIIHDMGEYGAGHGTGSFFKLGNRVFVLTNEHVAVAREQGYKLAYQLLGSDDLYRVNGDHCAFAHPIDLALLPVDPSMWGQSHNGSRAIELDQLALAHQTFPTEVLTFTGFPGDNVRFLFGQLNIRGQCLTGREVDLPEDNRFNSRFHFGIDYNPALTSDVVGDAGLSRPPGLSGSTVWNTNFVAAKTSGVPWTPELAKVTGVVWGWPSGVGCLIATRVEYLSSFLLSALAKMPE